MEFTNTHVKKVLEHIATRCLSLGRCLERALTHWDALKLYCFLLIFNLDGGGSKSDVEDGDKKQTQEKVFSYLNVLIL